MKKVKINITINFNDNDDMNIIDNIISCMCGHCIDFCYDVIGDDRYDDIDDQSLENHTYDVNKVIADINDLIKE